MSLPPINNPNAFSQTYSVVYENGTTPQYRLEYLAPSTGGVIYQPGVILARWNGSGPYPNQLVNYTAGGSDGQNVPVGIVIDNDMVLTAAAVASPTPIRYAYAATNFYVAKLIGTVSGDVTAAITAWNGVITYDSNGNQLAWKP